MNYPKKTNYADTTFGFSNKRSARANHSSNRNHESVQVVYTNAECTEVKYSNADVAATVLKICYDRNWSVPTNPIFHKLREDTRKIYTTVQLNDKVQSFLY